MKRRSLTIAWVAGVALVAALAVPAQAAMIAGWDFSQWAGDGALITDGTTFAFTDTLDANYSNLDPTNNAGAESAAFGTLYFNGLFGSTNVDETAFPPAFAPSAAAPESLVSNLTAPVVGGGVNPFDSLTILTAEGQDFVNTLSMLATTTLSVVFEADLSSVPEFGTDWSVSFGGKMSGGTSSLGIEFSSDGVNYTSFGSVNLTTVDSPFTVDLDAGPSDRAFVRFSFNPSGSNQPFIDNVAINASTVVPEPGTALLFGLGLVGVGLAGQRRRGARA